MDKITKMYYDAIDSEVFATTKGWDEEYVANIDKAASKCVEITNRTAVEFWVWMCANDTPSNAERFTNFTDYDMFEEFIKTR